MGRIDQREADAGTARHAPGEESQAASASAAARAGGVDRRSWVFVLGVLAWVVLTVGGWLLARPVAVLRTMEFTLAAPAGGVWALEWTRARDGRANGVWIEMPAAVGGGEGGSLAEGGAKATGCTERMIDQRVPIYRWGDLRLSPREASDLAAAEVRGATQAVRVFGVLVARVPVAWEAREGAIRFEPVRRAEPRETLVGMAIVGSVAGMLVVGAIGLGRLWVRGRPGGWTLDRAAWLAVIGAYAWMAAWAPMLYCPDSLDYVVGAHQIAKTGTTTAFEAVRVPGYGVFLLPFWMLPGWFDRWVGLAQGALGLATAGLAWGIARRVMARPWPGVVLLVVGLSPMLLSWQRFVMSESLSAFWVTLAAYLAVRRGRWGPNDPRGFGWAALGACVVGAACAAGAYTRGNLQIVVVLVPVLVGVAAWRRWGVGGAPVLGAIAFAVGVACLVPRVMHNQREYGTASFMVGAGYQRNITTQIAGVYQAWGGRPPPRGPSRVMDDNQTGVLDLEAWRELARGRAEGRITEYDAHEHWVGSERNRVDPGLKGWGERSAKLDVPALESMARRPDRGGEERALGFVNILGVWRSPHRFGFAENEFWSRPLRGIRDGWPIHNSNHLVDARHLAWMGEDGEHLFGRVQRDIGREIDSESARVYGTWFNVEYALQPVLAGLFLIGGFVALLRRDGRMVLITLIVEANAAGVAFLTLSGIDRYGVAFEPLLRVGAVYGVWQLAAWAERRRAARASA